MNTITVTIRSGSPTTFDLFVQVKRRVYAPRNLVLLLLVIYDLKTIPQIGGVSMNCFIKADVAEVDRTNCELHAFGYPVAITPHIDVLCNGL